MSTSRPTSPPLSHSPLVASLRKRSMSATPRKVDLELARLKQLGKVTKKTEEEDMMDTPARILSLGEPLSDGVEKSQQQLLVETRQELEQSQQQVKDYKQQLELVREKLDSQQQQLEERDQAHQMELVQQEKAAHDTITRYIGEYETSQAKVKQLAQLVETQDQFIQVLTEQQTHWQSLEQMEQRLHLADGDKENHSLFIAKQQLESAIGSLKANMETNQAHMQMMMMVSTEIQNDFEQQKVNMEKRLLAMAEELATKDEMLLRYQEKEQHQRVTLVTSSPSRSSLIHDSILTPSSPNTSRYPSFVSASSISSNGITSQSSLPSPSSSSSLSPRSPPLSCTAPPMIPAASSPPPIIPLPPIPSQTPTVSTSTSSTSSSSSTSSLKKQQHRYQQTQQQQQLRYFYQQQRQKQHVSASVLPPNILSVNGNINDAPIDPLISPTLRAGSLDELDNNGPFWKNMKNKWRTS